ncbi:pyrE [Symbiodinium natans]|uniref:orotate phosphoribosyltransferase n=1 Tax=Symbiodinium natans TaxID=878477 RepID=A0A812RV05_9DINO|nr:pyrE [Symbiodinium natans]
MAGVAHGFVEFALSQEVLRFGQFTLKSGRTSPYFFNAGLFTTGEALARLGDFYADAIVASGVEFDCIFGPAYKGITLAAAIAIALYKNHGRSVPYAYNRKEAKDHGEGGLIVGKLTGRVLIVDDVITAGTAIRESMDLLAAQRELQVVGVAVAMDRQEKVKEDENVSAIQQVERDFGIPVMSIAKMEDLITFIDKKYDKDDREALLQSIKEYRDRFGVSV